MSENHSGTFDALPHEPLERHRIAAILQGIMKRALEGTAASTRELDAGKRARPLADLGWRYG
jgi:hypothetical protein